MIDNLVPRENSANDRPKGVGQRIVTQRLPRGSSSMITLLEASKCLDERRQRTTCRHLLFPSTRQFRYVVDLNLSKMNFDVD